MHQSMALVLLLLASFPAVLTQGSGATDNELYAAYCKGAINGLDQAAPQVQQMSRRFSGYLFATGAMTDPRRRDAVLGIGAAMTRGLNDEKQCSATLLACDDAVNKAMRERPDTFVQKGEPGMQLLTCTERDPACPRTTRCLGPDTLPF